jgi:hypothetical protein
MRTDVFDDVIAERDALRQQVAMLTGALAAQDEREGQAGELCGVSREVHGCDWPDAVAEAVLGLKQRVATLTEALEWLVNLNCGVSKAGGPPVDTQEFIDAIDVGADVKALIDWCEHERATCDQRAAEYMRTDLGAYYQGRRDAMAMLVPKLDALLQGAKSEAC